MAITVAAFQSKVDEIVTALAAGDYAAAYSAYAQAEAINAGLEEEIGDHGRRIKRRESLEKLGAAITKAEGAAARLNDRGRFGRLGTRFKT